jgi:acyl-CoA synthetase (AMP-forming)/AMP-acid ligase II
MTYGDVARRTEQLAGMLVEKYDISAGGRVGVASANDVGYALALWAIARLGAISVGLNGWWTSAELRYGVELTTPKLLRTGGPVCLSAPARHAEDHRPHTQRELHLIAEDHGVRYSLEPLSCVGGAGAQGGAKTGECILLQRL